MSALLTAIFIVSVAAYVIGALIYSRVALEAAPPLRRLAFMGTLFTVIAIVVSVVHDHPWIRVAFPIYVGFTVYGWISSAHEATRRGARSTGIARFLIR